MKAKPARLLAFLTLCLSLFDARATEGTVPFKFSGISSNLFGQPIELTLAGGFNLDPNSVANLSTSPDGLFHSGTYTSPLNQIWGTFGEWSFSGTFYVSTLDGAGDWMGQDHWIIRSTLKGPTVNGWAPLNLNLFYYTSPGGISRVDLFPPHDPLLNPSADPYSLQFTLNFVDDLGVQDYTSGPLFEIRSVPEPSSATLIGMMIAVLILQKRRAIRARPFAS